MDHVLTEFALAVFAIVAVFSGIVIGWRVLQAEFVLRWRIKRLVKHRPGIRGRQIERLSTIDYDTVTAVLRRMERDREVITTPEQGDLRVWLGPNA